MVKIQCGNCGRKYQVSENAIGKSVSCKACGTEILVADPEIDTADAEHDWWDDLDEAPSETTSLPTSKGASPEKRARVTRSKSSRKKTKRLAGTSPVAWLWTTRIAAFGTEKSLLGWGLIVMPVVICAVSLLAWAVRTRQDVAAAAGDLQVKEINTVDLAVVPSGQRDEQTLPADVGQAQMDQLLARAVSARCIPNPQGQFVQVVFDVSRDNLARETKFLDVREGTSGGVEIMALAFARGDVHLLTGAQSQSAICFCSPKECILPPEWLLVSTDGAVFGTIKVDCREAYSRDRFCSKVKLKGSIPGDERVMAVFRRPQGAEKISLALGELAPVVITIPTQEPTDGAKPATPRSVNQLREYAQKAKERRGECQELGAVPTVPAGPWLIWDLDSDSLAAAHVALPARARYGGQEGPFTVCLVTAQSPDTAAPRSELLSNLEGGFYVVQFPEAKAVGFYRGGKTADELVECAANSEVAHRYFLGTDSLEETPGASFEGQRVSHLEDVLWRIDRFRVTGPLFLPDDKSGFFFAPGIAFSADCGSLLAIYEHSAEAFRDQRQSAQNITLERARELDSSNRLNTCDLCLWDLKTGRRTLANKASTRMIYGTGVRPDDHVAVSREGQFVARTRDGGDWLEFVDVASGDPPRQFSFRKGSGEKTKVTTAATRDQPATTAEVESQLPLVRIHALAFSPDNNTLALGSQGEVVTVKAEVGQIVQHFPVDNETVWAVQFSEDGRRIVAASQGAELSGGWTTRVWDVETGREVCQFVNQTGPVCTARFSPDGKYVLTSGLLSTPVSVWDIEAGKLKFAIESEPLPQPPEQVANSASELGAWNELMRTFVVSACFSRDSQWICRGDVTRLGLWETSTGKQIDWVGGFSHVVAACFTPDGKQLRLCARGPLSPERAIYRLSAPQ